MSGNSTLTNRIVLRKRKIISLFSVFYRHWQLTTWKRTRLTHIPLTKIAAILWTAFSNAFSWLKPMRTRFPDGLSRISNAFSWMKLLEFRLKFHWSLFKKMRLKCDSNQVFALFSGLGTKGNDGIQWYPEQNNERRFMILKEITCDIHQYEHSPPYFVFLKSLRPSDAYMRQ